jgi:hypothetical protein
VTVIFYPFFPQFCLFLIYLFFNLFTYLFIYISRQLSLNLAQNSPVSISKQPAHLVVTVTNQANPSVSLRPGAGFSQPVTPSPQSRFVFHQTPTSFSDTSRALSATPSSQTRSFHQPAPTSSPNNEYRSPSSTLTVGSSQSTTSPASPNSRSKHISDLSIAPIPVNFSFDLESESSGKAAVQASVGLTPRSL